MKLRDYQIDMVNKCRDRLSLHNKVGLQLPTGAGKTEIAIDIIKKSIKKKTKVCFATSSIDLINQTYNRFSKVFHYSDLSIIRADDPRYRDFAPVQILSVDTYLRRKSRNLIEDTGLFVIDEAHESVAEKYQRLFNDFEKY